MLAPEKASDGKTKENRMKGLKIIHPEFFNEPFSEEVGSILLWAEEVRAAIESIEKRPQSRKALFADYNRRLSPSLTIELGAPEGDVAGIEIRWRARTLLDFIKWRVALETVGEINVQSCAFRECAKPILIGRDKRAQRPRRFCCKAHRIKENKLGNKEAGVRKKAVKRKKAKARK
jgi:hypothetical protein